MKLTTIRWRMTWSRGSDYNHPKNVKIDFNWSIQKDSPWNIKMGFASQIQLDFTIGVLHVQRGSRRSPARERLRQTGTCWPDSPAIWNLDSPDFWNCQFPAWLGLRPFRNWFPFAGDLVTWRRRQTPRMKEATEEMKPERKALNGKVPTWFAFISFYKPFYIFTRQQIFCISLPGNSRGIGTHRWRRCRWDKRQLSSAS